MEEPGKATFTQMSPLRSVTANEFLQFSTITHDPAGAIDIIATTTATASTATSVISCISGETVVHGFGVTDMKDGTPRSAEWIRLEACAPRI